MECPIMKLNIKTAEALNPGKAPVDTSDSTIFTLARETVYCVSDQVSNYFAMFCGLHIE